MRVSVLSHTPEPEKLIASAAKLCYSSAEIPALMENLTPEKVSSFLDLLSSLGHESVFEHAVFTFGIEGVSRAVLAQITRHRIASFSVQSQRYVNKESFECVVPENILKNPAALAEFRQAMEEDRAHYKKLASLLTPDCEAELLAAGKSPEEAHKQAEKLAFEDARSVLPNACDTKIIMTMNVRSLYNFFSLRCCNRAQTEIRMLAQEMLRLVKEISPKLFAYAGPPCLRGACPEGKMSCGKASEIRAKYGVKQ